MSIVRAIETFLRRKDASLTQHKGIDWRPVKAGSAVSKAGRVVLRGSLSGQPVKIYEAENARHAMFIHAVTQSSPVSDLFPCIIENRDHAIVARWVSGASDRPSASDLASIQLRLHQTSVQSFPEPGFDYWMDLIWPRFKRAAGMLGVSSLAMHVHALVTPAWTGRKSLLHPDITPANVIRTGTTTWVVVDNELLTVGGIPLLDVCNTAHSFGRRGQEYADAYFAISCTKPHESEKAILSAAWLARRVGSSTISGDINSALLLIRQYEAGQVLPFAA